MEIVTSFLLQRVGIMQVPTDSSSLSSSSNESDYEINNIHVKRNKTFQDRLDISYFDDVEFTKRFRFSKNAVMYLESVLKNDLEPIDFRGYPLSTVQQIMIALRYYATGSFQIVLGDLAGISQSTAGNVVHRVSKAIARKNREFIKMPVGDSFQQTQEKFFEKARIPRCIGCIDGTHIPIISPGGEDAELYRNRKGYFSINTQVICDSDGKICDIVARYVIY